MKKRNTVLIIVIVVLALIAFSYQAGKQFGKKFFGSGYSEVVQDDSWLRLNLSGSIPEYSEMLPIRIYGLKKDVPSVHDIVQKIRRAKGDRRISGILLEPEYIGLSLASLKEIGLALEDFKESGKPIIAFGDMMDHGDYLLASYADEICMDPSASGGLLLTGSSANILFYKDLMDKFGIKMHVIQSGEYKGAGEPYSQMSLSEGTRLNIDAVLAERFKLITSELAERRELTKDDVLRIYNHREDFFIPAQKALDMGLIDKIAPKAELYDSSLINEDRVVNISSYQSTTTVKKSDAVAVAYLEGEIGFGSKYGQNQISHAKVKGICDDIKENKQVKAAVIRIDSPGGSALESEYIYRELKELAAAMPVVVSMGGTAASGGYYISCAGQYMLADPGSVVGSIGVIMLLPEATGLRRKVGLGSQTLKYGKFAGVLNPLEPYSPEVIASLKRSSEGTYDEFKSRVMEARKIEPTRINSIAEGRIFGAEDALALNLIDEIGTLQAAIDKAAELAGIGNYSLCYFPKKVNFLQALKDQDFFDLQISKLKNGWKIDLEAELIERLLSIEPYKWQYLCPVLVE